MGAWGFSKSMGCKGCKGWLCVCVVAWGGWGAGPRARCGRAWRQRRSGLTEVAVDPLVTGAKVRVLRVGLGAHS